MRLLFICILLLLAGSKAFSQTGIFVCPPCNGGCDTLTFQQPGNCPHCNMELISKDELKKQSTMKTSVCFYLQDGVEILDFAGPMEVFAQAGFHVFTVSKKKELMTSQGILKFMPDYSIDDAPTADILAFFGGNSGLASNDSAVIQWVRSRTPKYYFSVCTGAFILGQAGLLEKQTATTFHLSVNDLRERFPNTTVLADKRFVDNGRVITTAGISAGIDGALHIVSKLYGEASAARIARVIEYDKWAPGQGLIIGD